MTRLKHPPARSRMKLADSAQLSLDFSTTAPILPTPPQPTAPPKNKWKPKVKSEDRPATPAGRYFTRLEAAAYIRCSPRFFDGLPLPYIRKGRCKTYDRVDLDAYMQDDGHRGRAWKEIPWPEKLDSIDVRIRGTGGSASSSQMDAAYAKALGVSIAPKPRPSLSV